MQLLKRWPIYLIGRIFPAAIGFGAVALYTRLLDPANFGAYALLLSTAYLFGLIGYSWLRVASLRLMASVSDAEEINLAATIGIAFAVTSVPVALAVVLFVRIYSPTLGWTSALLAAACAVTMGWFELNVAIIQARLRVVTYGLLQLGRALAALLVSFTLILAGFKVNALLCGFAIGNCAGFGTPRLWIDATRGRFDRDLLVRFFRFGWPSSMGALSYFSNTFQRYALNLTGGSAMVGIYAAAGDFSQQTVGLLIGTAALAGQPLAFRARDLGDREELSQQLRSNARLIMAISLPATAGLIALSGPVSAVFLGPRFHVFNAGTVMAITAAVMFVSGIRSSYFEQAFEIALKTRAIALNTVVRVVLTVLFSLWSIPRYGAVGAGVAALIAEVIGLALSILWARNLMHLSLPWKDGFKITAATAGMLVAVALIPGRSTLVGLLVAILVGVAAYGVSIALMHMSGVRAYFGSFFPTPDRLTPL